MFKIGQKVMVSGNPEVVGYIVEMYIDPLEESDVAFEVENWIIYKVRVYREFYTDGYSDYGCTASDLTLVQG